MDKLQNITKIYLVAFLLSILLPNRIFSQGPNAPEAASFEPVDATDMVNLTTGDFSYVLPLLNVPSPEGGYPIALSYHGGIAMEQEASWTGLGWNVNPGAINRAVNGFPDDWGKTQASEFFFDQGWTEDSYSFSVGATINAVDVGVGVSWGSHRSTGGFISIGYVGFNATVGTDGASVGYGKGGYSASVGTNGVGLGYGVKAGGGTQVGVGLNYSYTSGLSGGISAGRSFGKENKFRGKASNASIGISFSSQGVYGSARFNGGNVGVAKSSMNVNSGDYGINVKTMGVSLSAYYFYASYSHTRVKYSLYKRNDLSVSGMVYPYHAIRTKNNNTSYLLEENSYMDANVFVPYSDQFSLDLLIDSEYKTKNSNIVLPNYDNYSVSAQGLSGNLRPSSYKELNLSGRGQGELNSSSLYAAYVSKPFDGWLDRYNDLGGYTHFYFDNSYDSFLRVKKGNIYNSSFTELPPSDYRAYLFNTGTDNTYSENQLPTGEYLKNGNRKRQGKYIETYTNKQIKEGNVVGFIEAKDLDRQDNKTFLDNGIGAYKITTLDGKTYHYSLPVYNYESFYKNFKSNEHVNFFESSKLKPFATHWLLTAVTGPDYIDVNTDGKLDSDDYGYWVEFEYGKWSDGYVWKGPRAGYDENANGQDITYSYTWGRKQIYYLDAVKTRTHTALFIKNLRKDNLSSNLDKYNVKWVSGSFDQNIHSKTYITSNRTFDAATTGETLYSGTGVPYTIGQYDNMHSISGFKGAVTYVDIPENKSLKLEKIILLKNADVPDVKNLGAITTTLRGALSKNAMYKYVSGFNTTHATPVSSPGGHATLYVYPPEDALRSFDIHLHQNVIDVADIVGLNLEDKADQVIEFDHDYSLAKNSVNSELITSNLKEGRLSLKEVRFKGKKGTSIIPPYKFLYNNPEISYHKTFNDTWGYHKDIPEIWSLKEIQTPTGGKIQIGHESDSYYAEAAVNKSEVFENINVEVYSDNTTNDLKDIEKIKVTFNDNIYLNDYFEEGTGLPFKCIVKGSKTMTWLPPYSSFPLTNITPYEDNIMKYLTVDEIGGNYIILKTPNAVPFYLNHEKESAEYNYFHLNTNGITTFSLTEDYCQEGPTSTLLSTTYTSQCCYTKPSVQSNTGVIYTKTDYNGKKGGGVRTKSIKVVENGLNAITTEYIYTNPIGNRISGITSYAPTKEARAIPYISEIPQPMVVYEHVAIKNTNNDNSLMGSTSYQFEVLKPFVKEEGALYSLGEHFKVKQEQNDFFLNGSVRANKYTIYNKLGNLGRLLSVTTKNNKEQVLSKKVINYKNDLDKDGEIGVTQESYKSNKRVRHFGIDTYLVNSSSKVVYPSVLESNIISEGGFTSKTNYDKYDFLTGQVLETSTIGSDGTKFKTKIVPAYTITQYSGVTGGYGMGAKVDNVTNSNMLSQQAASYSYLYDTASSSWKETGVGISTWNKDWVINNPISGVAMNNKVWRKHKSYVWEGGLNDNGSLQGYQDNFDWTIVNPPQEPEWKKTSETTKYNAYSMPLELRDINSNYIATRMGENNTKVIATCNSKYSDMIYTGAEYPTVGNLLTLGNVIDVGTNAHTGTKIIAANYEQEAINLQFSIKGGGDYKMSVWAHKDNVNNVWLKMDTSAGASYVLGEKVTAGDWVLLNYYLTFPSTGVYEIVFTSSGGVVKYDDFRIHPIASSMTSYVYNKWDELSYILDANNLGTHYEYDEAGRLIKTYTEVVNNTTVIGGFKMIGENNYNYRLN